MKLNSVLATAVSTLAVSVIAAFSFSSQAFGLTFNGESNGTWGNPNPGSNTNPTFTGVGTNVFKWGKAIPDDPAYGTDANTLTFIGNKQFSTEVGSLFKIGNLAYFNGTVPLGTHVDSVPLNLSLSFASPVNYSEAFKFDFELYNTPNLGTTPEENADSVITMNKFGDRSFTDNQGIEYVLEMIGFSQDGGVTTVHKFDVLEGEQTTAGIYARITRVTPPQQVPEPASLFGLSVLGIYIFSRKNKFLKEKN
ncbi:MAG: choice-of-anchor K domain-containing protein [Scytonema sp. PMC 1069.18]|nr:choice-of-anchor K domain-containing protein [Scytonema sp. PMC 1069.18]MEC4886693.1 choice-of-anchor K domain-containing protein [Scytonema sp. PMC 1070.18]